MPASSSTERQQGQEGSEDEGQHPYLAELGHLGRRLGGVEGEPLCFGERLQHVVHQGRGRGGRVDAVGQCHQRLLVLEAGEQPLVTSAVTQPPSA
jgi:hypothetical protein